MRKEYIAIPWHRTYPLGEQLRGILPAKVYIWTTSWKKNVQSAIYIEALLQGKYDAK